MRALLLVAVLATAGCAAPPPAGEAEVLAPAANATRWGNGTALAEPTLVAEGTILVGSPTTNFRSTNVIQREATGAAPADGIDSFFFDTPPVGAWLWTETSSGTAVPYQLDIFFRDADWAFLDDRGCATASAEERCTVPAGAVHANVDARTGADLTVRLWTGCPPDQQCA